MTAINIAKIYCDITDLPKINDVPTIPKPELGSLNYKTRDEITDLNNKLSASCSLHKEALEHKRQQEIKKIIAEQDLNKECAAIVTETIGYNTKVEKDLANKTVELENAYHKELEEAEKQYQLIKQNLLEKRNRLIKEEAERTKQLKAKHLKENEIKKEQVKENLNKEVKLEESKFKTCVDKLKSVNKTLTDIINLSNTVYNQNKTILEKFAAL